MNNRIRYLILFLLLSTSLHPRTTRKKSTVDPIAQTQAPQSTIEPKIIQKEQIKTETPTNITGSKEQEITDQEEPQGTPKATSGQGTNQVIFAFYRKLQSSALFLKEALDASFNYLITTSRHPKAFNSQQVNFQRNNIIYFINKHLREVVSAFTDRNSFLNGALLEFFMRMQNDPIIQAKQVSFMLNFSALSDELKKFAIKRLDQNLSKEITNQIRLIEERTTYLSLSAMEHKDLTAVTNQLITILRINYIESLQYLLKKLETPAIKGILPLPETLKTKVARKIKKITNPILGFAALKARQEIDQIYTSYLTDAYIIARSFVLSPLIRLMNQSEQQISIDNQSESWSQWLLRKINNTVTNSTISYTQGLIEGFIDELEARYIYSLIMNIRYVPFIILYYWLLNKHNDQEINLLMNAVDSLYSAKFAALYDSSSFLSTYITSFFYALEKSEESSEERKKIIAQNIQNLQIEVYRHRRLIISELTNNDSITNQYLTLLDSNSRRIDDRECNETFLQTPDGQELINTLKSAESSGTKEDLHNAYINYTQEYDKYKASRRFFPLTQSVIEQARQVVFDDENVEKAVLLDSLTKLPAYNQANITSALTETMQLCKKKITNLDAAIEALQSANNSIPLYPSENKNTEESKKLKERVIGLKNAEHINKLLTAAPSDEDRIIMRARLTKNLKRIREEIQSFGQRTSYQMLRSALQINIDQEYAIKLKAHLQDLENDISNLMKDANHVITPINSSGNPYYNTSYFVSQGIQNTEGEKITIPYPLVSPAVAYTIKELIEETYIKPLKLLVEKTNKESPLWKMLPQKTLLKTFITPHFMQFKIAGKIASNVMQYIIWELPLSTSIRIILAPYQVLADPKTIVEKVKEGILLLGRSSLSTAAIRFMGPWMPQAISRYILSSQNQSLTEKIPTILGRTAAEVFEKGLSFSKSKIGSESLWQTMQRDIKDRMYRIMRPLARVAREI